MEKTESRPQIAFFKKVSRLEEKKSFYESGTKKVLQTEAIWQFQSRFNDFGSILEKKTRKFDACLIDNRREITANGDQSQVGGAGIG